MTPPLYKEDGRIEGGLGYQFEQTVKAHRNETIARLNWTRANLAGFSFEAGAEAFVSKRDLRIALHPIVATLVKQQA